jgi:hypothetical protein
VTPQSKPVSALACSSTGRMATVGSFWSNELNFGGNTSA